MRVGCRRVRVREDAGGCGRVCGEDRKRAPARGRLRRDGGAGLDHLAAPDAQHL